MMLCVETLRWGAGGISFWAGLGNSLFRLFIS